MSRLHDGEPVSMVSAYYRREADEREPEDDEPDPVEEDERAVVEAAERAAEC